LICLGDDPIDHCVAAACASDADCGSVARGHLHRAIVEACIGKTIAAAEPSTRASTRSTPPCAGVLGRIAEDEARYAELGTPRGDR
jgi:hypothetical protein